MIGPNGAGKTTLLSILAGIREPDAGEVAPAARQVGFVPQQAALYRRLTVDGEPAPLRPARGASTTSRPAVEADARADRLSPSAAAIRSGRSPGGNQQRINIAIGLLSEPGGAAPRRAVAPASTRASARASGSSSSASPARGTTRDLLHPQHRRGRALRRPRARASPTASACSTARRRAQRRRPADRRRGRQRRLRVRLRPLPGRARALDHRATGAPSKCAGYCSRTCRSCGARRWSRRCWSSTRS